MRYNPIAVTEETDKAIMAINNSFIEAIRVDIRHTTITNVTDTNIAE